MTAQPAHADPCERLAKMRREFGEWGGVNAGVEISTTFTVLEADTLPAIFSGKVGPDRGGCYLYGRSFSPTVRHLGRQLAALEGSEAAYCCSSGMAAISCTLLSLCNSGDHIVASNAVYGGTFALLKDFLPQKCGITTTFVPINDLEAVRAAITDKTKVVYTESLSNPTLVVADIPALAELAHSRGPQLVVDNTFTPVMISPIQWGADVVVHSLTKFISGASDTIAGAVCGRSDFIASLMDLHLGSMMLLGPTMDPKVASELSLRIPHLGLRIAEHSRRALRYAERLQELGAQVTYPGLPQHPQHATFTRLANPGYGYGGMLTLQLDSLAKANALMERLQNHHGFGLLAVSLGYFDTLMSASAVSTSSELDPDELAGAGITSGLVRLSVGLTGSLEQRQAQLEEAYLTITGGGGAKAPRSPSCGSLASADTGDASAVPASALPGPSPAITTAAAAIHLVGAPEAAAAAAASVNGEFPAAATDYHAASANGEFPGDRARHPVAGMGCSESEGEEGHAAEKGGEDEGRPSKIQKLRHSV